MFTFVGQFWMFRCGHSLVSMAGGICKVGLSILIRLLSAVLSSLISDRLSNLGGKIFIMYPEVVISLVQ